MYVNKCLTAVSRMTEVSDRQRCANIGIWSAAIGRNGHRVSCVFGPHAPPCRFDREPAA